MNVQDSVATAPIRPIITARPKNNTTARMMNPTIPKTYSQMLERQSLYLSSTSLVLALSRSRFVGVRRVLFGLLLFWWLEGSLGKDRLELRSVLGVHAFATPVTGMVP